MGGGLGYTEERLRAIWSRGLDVRSIRRMNKPATGSGRLPARTQPGGHITPERRRC